MFFKKIATLVFTFLIISCGENGLFGNINEGKGNPPVFKDQNLEFANCELDPDEFLYILEKNISTQINCLYNQLSLYMESVEAAYPEVLSESQKKNSEKPNFNIRFSKLKQYIENKRPEFSYLVPEFLFYFELVNFGVGNTEIDVLYKHDLEFLRDFLLMFNKEMVSLSQYMVALDDSDLPWTVDKHSFVKEKIIKSAMNLASKARNAAGEDVSVFAVLSRQGRDGSGVPISTDLPPNNNQISLKKVLTQFLTIDRIDTVNSMLKFDFVKRMFLGGSPKNITRAELKTLAMKKLVPGLEMFYDIYRYQDFEEETKAVEFKYTELQKHLKNFETKLLYKGDDLTSYFSLGEMYDFLDEWGERFFGLDFKPFGLRNYEWEILKIKNLYLGNRNKEITYSDMREILSWSHKMTKMGLDFSKLYEVNKEIINSGKKIGISNSLRTSRNIDDPRGTMFTNFQRVLVKYRYFRDKDGVLPKYGNQYVRNLSSLILTYQLESLLAPIIADYEKRFPCAQIMHKNIGENNETSYVRESFRCGKGEDYNKTLSAIQVAMILKEFIGPVEQLGVVSKGGEVDAAGNVASIADLFLFSSNGDGVLQKEEITEFIFNLMYSIEIKSNVVKMLSPVTSRKKVLKTFTKKAQTCAVVDNVKKGDKRYPQDIQGVGKRYDPTCVRNMFYSLFSNLFGVRNSRVDHQSKYFNYFIKFKQFHDSSSQEEKFKLMLLLEKYTRSCAHDNMPFSESDIMALYSGIMNIESTLAKFDFNNDNIINIAETDATYEHFKNALLGIEPLLGTTIPAYFNLPRKAFNYIVDKKKVPKGGTPAKIWKLVFNAPKKPAYRDTLAAVLVALAGEGDVAKFNDYNCLNHCFLKDADFKPRKYISQLSTCKSRLPKTKGYSQKLNCSVWSNYFKGGDEIPRNDCDIPVKYNFKSYDETDLDNCKCE